MFYQNPSQLEKISWQESPGLVAFVVLILDALLIVTQVSITMFWSDQNSATRRDSNPHHRLTEQEALVITLRRYLSKATSTLRGTNQKPLPILGSADRWYQYETS